MKNTIILAVSISILVLNGYLLYLNMNLRNEQAETKRKMTRIEQQIEGLSIEDEPELAEHMQQLLTYSNKLWFSGIAGNQELRYFYIHEIEEKMETIYDLNMNYDGAQISPLIQQFGIKAIENFEEKLDSGEEFEAAYKILINECNNCHNSAMHSYVKIKVPENPAFDNQEYRLAE